VSGQYNGKEKKDSKEKDCFKEEKDYKEEASLVSLLSKKKRPRKGVFSLNQTC
jgi:hypothetical protein